MCALWCATAAALLLGGGRLPLRLAAVSAAAMAARAADDCAVFRDCGNLADAPPYPVAAALLTALAAALAAARAARAARRAAAGDRRLYAAAWEAVCRREPAALRSLAVAADALAAAAQHGAEGSVLGGGGGGGDGLRGAGPPVPSGPLRQGGPAPASLDRLWAQAVGLAPLLAPRAAAWAAAGGGAVRPPVPAAGGRAPTNAGDEEAGPLGGSSPAGDGGDDPGGQEHGGDWAGCGWRGLVKDPRRAAWKARACYGGDAGRLLDLCRARLVFPDAAGAAACLRALAADPGARALRVRNGMWDGGGGGGGFRVRNPPPSP
jgi:hypothetical protein